MSQAESSNSESLFDSLKSKTAVAGESASRQDRFVAALIDGVIVAVAASCVSVPLLMSGMIPFLLVSVVSAAVGFGVFLAINYKFLQDGQTLGKKLMKLKMVSEDGSQPEVNDLLMKRYSVYFLAGAVPYVGGLLALANALMIFRESKNCFHDDVAKTRVVNV